GPDGQRAVRPRPAGEDSAATGSAAVDGTILLGERRVAGRGAAAPLEAPSRRGGPAEIHRLPVPDGHELEHVLPAGRDGFGELDRDRAVVADRDRLNVRHVRGRPPGGKAQRHVAGPLRLESLAHGGPSRLERSDRFADALLRPEVEVLRY